MINTYRRILAREIEDETDEGFTLIEILIVIVVIGILAAVVIIALGGIVGKSAVAACQADGATVASAISALENQNPAWGVVGTNGASNALTTTQLLAGGGLSGDPYLGSWPSNTPHYTYTMSGGQLQLAYGTVPASNFTGPTQCSGVV